jgi:protein subunit release factor B
LPTGITRLATESRSQWRNRELALARLLEELRRRARRPKPRMATKPTRVAVEKRLAGKRRAALKKSRRAGGVAESESG